MDEFNKDPKNSKDKKSRWSNAAKGFRKIFEKDGFYIILFICICLVGTTAVWVSTQNMENTNNAQEKDNTSNIVVEKPSSDDQLIEKLTTLYDSSEGKNEDSEAGKTDEEDIQVVNIEKAPEARSTQEENKQKQNEEQKTKASSNQPQVQPVSAQSKAISMVMPLKGTISMEFAMDKLVFSKTLEQWTTHNGIDISAREGSVVRAAMDGVVASIKEDYAIGMVITLDHGNGLLTRYGGVSTDEMVKVGQHVKKGDPITGVGKGAGFEVAQGPHLHFEVIKDGKNIDPKQYLPYIE